MSKKTAFEDSSDAEKHGAAAEILRTSVLGDLPESALVEVAEEVFQKLDEEEGGHEHRKK